MRKIHIALTNQLAPLLCTPQSKSYFVVFKNRLCSLRPTTKTNITRHKNGLSKKMLSITSGYFLVMALVTAILPEMGKSIFSETGHFFRKFTANTAGFSMNHMTLALRSGFTNLKKNTCVKQSTNHSAKKLRHGVHCSADNFRWLFDHETRYILHYFASQIIKITMLQLVIRILNIYLIWVGNSLEKRVSGLDRKNNYKFVDIVCWVKRANNFCSILRQCSIDLSLKQSPKNRNAHFMVQGPCDFSLASLCYFFFQNYIEFDRIFSEVNTNEIQSSIHRFNKTITTFISRRIIEMSYYLKAQSFDRTRSMWY